MTEETCKQARALLTDLEDLLFVRDQLLRNGIVSVEEKHAIRRRALLLGAEAEIKRIREQIEELN